MDENPSAEAWDYCGRAYKLVLKLDMIFSQSEASWTKSQLDCELEATALDYYVDDIAIITA